MKGREPLTSDRITMTGGRPYLQTKTPFQHLRNRFALLESEATPCLNRIV